MRTVTLEEHFLSTPFREILQKSAPDLGMNRLLARPGEFQAKLTDLGALRLRDMDVSGVDLQVISHTPKGEIALSGDEEVSLMQAANDQLAAAVAAHPDRFAGFAILPMTAPEVAAGELERSVRSLGFKGAMIHGTTNGRFLDDPVFLPVLEQAVALDVPIYLHPAEPPAAVQQAYYTGLQPEINLFLSTGGWGWHSEIGIHALRLILAGVFDRLPTLQIIIGHMGEMIPFMLDRINETFTPRAKYLQRQVPEYFLQNFFITTSGFFSESLLPLALQTVGADRILYSVDYPFASNEEGRAFLERISLNPTDKEKITHLNAERLLKLPQA